VVSDEGGPALIATAGRVVRWEQIPDVPGDGAGGEAVADLGPDQLHDLVLAEREVLAGDPANPGDGVWREGRTAPAAPGFSSPDRLEGVTMPADEGFRPDDDERILVPRNM